MNSYEETGLLAFIDEREALHIFHDTNQIQRWLAQNGYFDTMMDKDEIIDFLDDHIFLANPAEFNEKTIVHPPLMVH